LPDRNLHHRTASPVSRRKIKNVSEGEFVLIGLERDSDGGLVRSCGAREKDRELEYAGMAFMTFGRS
jgi:hypothetical protein